MVSAVRLFYFRFFDTYRKLLHFERINY